MDIKQYKQQEKALTVKLTAGMDLELAYYPNFVTGEVLSRMEAREQARYAPAPTEVNEADKDKPVQPRLSFRTIYDEKAQELADCLARLDLTEDGQPVPFGTEDEKLKALSIFSNDDLSVLTNAVRDDIAAPLAKPSDDSASGPPPKDE